ncbi:hypothetical protein [Leptospira interrogans]|uniref:Uncharacterized protein n=1 Tax=Leptospira interrogans TaxID=173 RepID=A0AAV9FQ46_LEPIR|nr:hypothetical protein [Leptospira interrogans]KAK2617624.1 hypothetical protein CFV95_000630 [Leptospira interrogans]
MIESRKYFQSYNKSYEYSKNVKYSIPEYSKSKNNFQFSFYNKLIIFSKNLIKFLEKTFTKPKGKLSSRQISG